MNSLSIYRYRKKRIRRKVNVNLHHFGFGHRFCHWITTFYTKNISQVLINGMPSSFFYIDAGVRQGDPLSTGLFVVFIEPLLNYLRHRLSSLGIQVPTHPTPHLLLAFSDYVIALLLDISHVPTFLSDVQTSCSAVGLTLNVSKTVAMTSVHGRHIFSRHSPSLLHLIGSPTP